MFKRSTKLISGIALGAALIGSACAGPADDAGKNGGIDMEAVTADGKSDLAKRVKILDSIAPESEVTGKFDPRVRTYGYVVEARRGASLNIVLEATAGSDAQDLKAGEALDTVIAVYGPFTDRSNPGEKLLEADDDGDSVTPAPLTLDVEKDGKYLIVFASYDDTGEGDYNLTVQCDGTDLQCKRPDFEKPCKTGQLFVQGGKIDADTMWESCEVILLEPTIVEPDTTLTIRPGVEVKGNFLSDNANQPFGQVSLDVRGTLQAVGTPEHPIAFTAFTERGWRGLILTGEGHSVEHAYIEKAQTGVQVQAGSSATISDVVIEGTLKIEETEHRGAAGIRAEGESNVVFQRALVKGFQIGVLSNQNETLLIEDSVIRENDTGVRVQGANPTSQCRNFNPPVFRDPKLVHTDIIHNRGIGIDVQGSDAFLQVSKSNIVSNQGVALAVNGSTLHEESFLRENNIFENNGGGVQVQSFHRQGVLDLSANHWVHISDPELSQTRQSNCNGEINFSGFSPAKIADAGPREDRVIDDVKQQSWKQSQ